MNIEQKIRMLEERNKELRDFLLSEIQKVWPDALLVERDGVVDVRRGEDTVCTGDSKVDALRRALAIHRMARERESDGYAIGGALAALVKVVARVRAHRGRDVIRAIPRVGELLDSLDSAMQGDPDNVPKGPVAHGTPLRGRT